MSGSGTADGAVSDASTGSGDVLLLGIAGEWHALRVGEVREVVPWTPVAEVPGSPSWLRGLVNLRGDVLPVIDPCASFPVDEPDPLGYLVIVDTEEGPAAIGVQHMPLRVAQGERLGGLDDVGSAGRFVAGDKVCTLLRLDALLSEFGVDGP